MNAGSFRRIGALGFKETLQILRDPSSLLIAGLLPLILLFLFGYGVSLDTTNVRVGIVVEMPDPATRDLAAAFAASRYFTVRQGTDVREFRDDLVAGRLKGIVVIPAEFTADRLGGRKPAIAVLTDGADPNTAGFVARYAEGVIANWAAQNAGIGPAITASPRFWFNPELTSRYFLVPGSIAIVMTLIGTLLTALVIAREWERGTMEGLMATPVTTAEFLVAKLVPYFLLGLASMALCVGIAVLAFGVPFRGSLLALVALSAAFLCPALGQGLLISAATKNQFVASQVALLTGFLPAFILSGFIFEIGSMPQVIQWITYIVPARYLIPGLQTVFLTGDVWPLFLPDIAVMLGMGILLFAAAARNTRKRLD